MRQAVLPALAQVIRPDRDDPFAHPAERDLAHLFTFYGVRWAYEPTTFALTPATGDQRTEFFTPDFYLPEHRLYIELTTMRQRLVTRKNRKLRRLREAYPGVSIKLLYRRDYLQLVDAYNTPLRSRRSGQIDQVLFSEDTIASRIDELAGEIAAEWARTPGRPPVLVGVGRGSARFHDSLTGALERRGLKIEADQLIVSRYCRTGRGQRARVQQAPSLDLTGRRVLLVEDVVSTGLSLAFVVDWLLRRGAREVSACALLNRAESRLVQVPVRHVGFEVPAAVLAGYGLSLRRQFSDLPYIASVLPA